MTKEDLKGYFDKGVEGLKSVIDKSGKAASKFGDESILRIEIQQLKSQIKKDMLALGELASKAFIDDGADSLLASDERVLNILESIKKARDEISLREEKLKKC